MQHVEAKSILPLFLETSPWDSTSRIISNNHLASSVLQEIPSEYIERFHNRSILIIDDNLELGARTQEQLAELYTGTVKYIASPKKALLHLQNGAPDATYDCIVLDVMMPEMWGTDFLKQLTGNIPAIVFYTMSISNDAFADACEQLGTYMARGTKSLIEMHASKLNEVCVPPAPILRQHKTGSLLDLALKIDHAMLLKDSGFGNFAGFLSYYDPQNFPKSPSSLCVHRFSEITVELSHQLEALIIKNSTASHSTIRPQLTEQLELLRAVTFHSLVGETPKDTNERMHEAIFMVTSFCRTNPSSFISNVSDEFIKEWISITSETLTKVNETFNTHRKLSSGIKDAETTIKDAAKNAGYSNIYFGYSDEYTPINVNIVDPENQISSLLAATFEAFSARSRVASKYPASCAVHLVSESERADEELQRRTLLSQINAGDFIQLTFYDCTGTSLDDLAGSIGPRLAGLIRSKKGAFTTYSNEGDNYFSLYIKLTEYTGRRLDFDEIEQKGENSFVLNDRLLVTEKIVGDRKLAILGDLPECWQNGQKPLYFVYGNHHILSSGNAFTHAAAYFAIADYLSHVDIDNFQMRAFWKNSDSNGYIYDQAVRLEADFGLLFIDAEQDSDSSLYLVDLLNNFGIKDETIEFQSWKFHPKAHLKVILPPTI